MHLVIEFEPNEGPGEGAISVKLTVRSVEKIEEIHQQVNGWGLKSEMIHIRSIRFRDAAEISAIHALWALLDEEPKEVWHAIETIAKEAFLAGLASGRAGEIPVPVAVK